MRLRRYPVVRGRAVLRGRPVADARVAVRWEAGAESSESSETADADGRFALVLDRFDLTAASVTVRDAAGLAGTDVALAGPFAGVRDLGDVEVPDAWAATMLVEVVDAAGAAVAGAVAAIGGERTTTIGPSGADGRLQLPAGAAAGRAILVAPGFGAASAELAPTGGTAVRVALARSADLRLRVTGPNGPPPGATVRIGGGGRVFDEPPDTVVYELYDALGLAHPSSSERGGDGDMSTYRVEDAQEIGVPWLVPDRPFRVTVFDAYGEVLADRDERASAGATTLVVLACDVAPRSVRGVVRDASGAPVAGARVVARAPASIDETDGVPRVRDLFVVVVTGADGAFTFEGVHGRALAVLVSARGHAPFVRRSLDVSGDAAVEVQLARGRTLVVRVTGATERVSDVWAEPRDPELWRAGPRPWIGFPREDGSFEVADLPPGEVDVVVTVGDRDVRRRVAADATAATVDMSAADAR